MKLLAHNPSPQGVIVLERLTRYHVEITEISRHDDIHHYLRSTKYDALILTEMAEPHVFLRQIRAWRSDFPDTPMILLSAQPTLPFTIGGLEAGLDDVMPFEVTPIELLAKVQALKRRYRPPMPRRLKVRDLSFDTGSRVAVRQGRTVSLQPKESKLLEYLMVHSGQVISRTQILAHVWDSALDPVTNVIDVHMYHLRQKIDKSFREKLIQTIPGLGYRLGP